jgi:predicted HTH transcriptional regulator
MTHSIPADRLKRQIYWHALPVGWEQLDYQEFLERRRQLIARVVRDGFQVLRTDRQVPRASETAADLLSRGESETLEFKSSARWNIRVGMADKKMEQVLVKTVCGFLNAQGGTLLIGVDDERRVIGLSNDFKTLGSKPDKDGFELFLRQRLDSDLSVSTAGVIKIRFEKVGDLDVCVVSVAASGKPVFSRPHDGAAPASEFWVRIGNATRQLYGDEMVKYQEDHWG